MMLNDFEKIIDNHVPPTVFQLCESICYTNGTPSRITNLAKNSRETFFDFDYPLSDKVDKEQFEINIINHFLMRRIGQETFTAFRLFLSNKLNEIMPKYNMLFDAGADGFTMFQETYNEDIFPVLHPIGEKGNFIKRLDSPELACKAGYNNVNLGALLGLDVWRHDTFFTGLHAKYLQDKYPGSDIAVSIPRICEHEGITDYNAACSVKDIDLVQAMLAYRIFLPRLGITISTREPAKLRDRLIGLGVTKMSAGSITEVGGHGQEKKSDGQFEITDTRSVDELAEAIKKRGYQPVFKDWESIATP